MALTVKLTRQQRRVDTVKPKNLKSPKNGSERITMNCKIAEQQTRQIMRLDGDVTWSKSGIGYCLLQKHCRCQKVKPFCCKTGWKTVLIGSRFTHSSESRYAPIEGEALAVADALERARYFVLGCRDLIVAVDHKPLLKILSDRVWKTYLTIVSEI